MIYRVLYALKMAEVKIGLDFPTKIMEAFSNLNGSIQTQNLRNVHTFCKNIYRWLSVLKLKQIKCRFTTKTLVKASMSWQTLHRIWMLN